MLLMLPLAALLSANPGAPVKYPGLDALIDAVGVRFEQQVQTSMSGMHTVRVHNEELDDDGKVVHVQEQVLESVGEGAAREFRLISATEDGKDVTAEHRAKHDAFVRDHPNQKHEEHSGHGGIGLDHINPFTKAERNKYMFWVVGPLPAPGAPVHLHFKPWEASKERYTGDAMVDPATGAIRDLSITPSDLPMFVKALSIHAALGADHANDVDIDAAGGVLFWHKHFRAHLTFGYLPPDKT